MGEVDRVLQFFMAIAVVYDLAEGGEDFWLVKLFSKESEVTRPEGAIACGLTQAKLAAIVLSIVGGLLFLVLDKLFTRS
jgi:hypothetical protein